MRKVIMQNTTRLSVIILNVAEPNATILFLCKKLIEFDHGWHLAHWHLTDWHFSQCPCPTDFSSTGRWLIDIFPINLWVDDIHFWLCDILPDDTWPINILSWNNLSYVLVKVFHFNVNIQNIALTLKTQDTYAPGILT